MTDPLSVSSAGAAPTTAPLRFWHRQAVRSLRNVPPHQTLLNLLRDDLQLPATKEGCAAGDCGACTVVLGEVVDGQLQYKAVNSCIKPAQAVHGMALWTADDLCDAQGRLHPAQQALVDHHGSQCGFCTPGFVMSLFGLYQRCTARGQAVGRHQALQALSGNLCRCTGYRPIVQAATGMRPSAAHRVDEAALVQALQGMAEPSEPSAYQRPRQLTALLQARARWPQATVLAGGTDAGLWISQGLRDLPHILDLSRVAELRRIERYPHHLALGAAVPLQAAFEALAQDRPAVSAFAERFAGWPIRQSGTLGGNVANGSPIGDGMPLLLALDAHLVLMAWRRGRVHARHVPLHDFYTGYRQNRLAADEVLAWIVVPHPRPDEWLGLYKISKRQEDDISAVCLALAMERDAQDRITGVRIGAGGVAATPARAWRTEQAMLGHTWDRQTLAHAQAALAQEFQPLTDLRASAQYRRTVMGQLLERAWLESHGHAHVRLEDLA